MGDQLAKSLLPSPDQFSGWGTPPAGQHPGPFGAGPGPGTMPSPFQPATPGSFGFMTGLANPMMAGLLAMLARSAAQPFSGDPGALPGAMPRLPGGVGSGGGWGPESVGHDGEGEGEGGGEGGDEGGPSGGLNRAGGDGADPGSPGERGPEGNDFGQGDSFGRGGSLADRFGGGGPAAGGVGPTGGGPAAGDVGDRTGRSPEGTDRGRGGGGEGEGGGGGAPGDPGPGDGRDPGGYAYGKGGVVTKKTKAVIGEKGPEAVVPLRPGHSPGRAIHELIRNERRTRGFNNPKRGGLPYGKPR